MTDNVITEINRDRALELLATVSLGRLVTVHDGRADIFPVNYAVSPEGTLFFRTAEGTKLASITVQPDVLFQVDQLEGDSAWSIIVRGSARRLESFTEINAAEELDLKPWLPTLKYNFVEITPDHISGRGFIFGEEPERYTGY